MKVRDYAALKPFVKIAGYGENGTGKTSDAARSPMPLFISCEEQSIQAILDVNPEAEFIHVPDAPTLFEVTKSLKAAGPIKLDNGQPALLMKHGGEEIVFQTLVPDSVTDIQELMKAHIIGRRFDDWKKKGKGEPGTFDDVMETRDWGRLAQYLGAFLRDIRALDCNLYALFLDKTDTDDKGNVLRIRPWVDGQIGRKVGRYFSGIGLFMKRGVQESVVYGIAWDMPSPRLTKRPPRWPYHTVNDHSVPGKVTLGSLALYTFGEGDHVPHVEGDSAEHVHGLIRQQMAAEVQEDGE